MALLALGKQSLLSEVDLVDRHAISLVMVNLSLIYSDNKLLSEKQADLQSNLYVILYLTTLSLPQYPHL